ncbi:hypothetical protein [Metabacillus idriensis]|uniref:hypothetical protein n=1 Tax=Metabacillus idriensis TaxID=324768 RepID=UPI001749C472|nr:hypothetical protein [Metabacillus idriensis]
MQKSSKLTSLIKAFKAEEEKIHAQTGRIEELKQKIESDIVSAKEELHKLISALIADPSEKNRTAEVKLRDKIESLEKELASMDDRRQHAMNDYSKNSQELSHAAVEQARVEALSHINANVDAAADAIEQAKFAYLKAMVAYHRIGAEARKLFTDTQNELNTLYGSDNAPYMPELHIFNTAGARQVHGCFQNEQLDALKSGIIRKTSVAAGRAINDSLYS